MLFSAIQQAFRDVDISVKRFLKSSVPSLALASLAQRLWISANQLASDQYARDKAFYAAQRLFALSEDQEDVSVDCFVRTNRIGR